TTWTMELLPRLPSGGNGIVAGAARAADGTLLFLGVDDSVPSTKNGSMVGRPVVWRRSGGVWLAPQRYTIASGASQTFATGINGQGQDVAMMNGATSGAIWDTPTSP